MLFKNSIAIVYAMVVCISCMRIIWNAGIGHVEVEYAFIVNTIIYFWCVHGCCVIAALSLQNCLSVMIA